MVKHFVEVTGFHVFIQVVNHFACAINSIRTQEVAEGRPLGSLGFAVLNLHPLNWPYAAIHKTNAHLIFYCSHFYEACTAPAWLVVLKKTGHFQFLDQQTLLQQAICVEGPTSSTAVRSVGQVGFLVLFLKEMCLS